MLGPLLTGLGVALISFGLLEVVVRTKPTFTLPSLLLAILAGQLLRFAFTEVAGMVYLLAWMLGMSVCVMLGFAMRAARKAKNDGRKK